MLELDWTGNDRAVDLVRSDLTWNRATQGGRGPYGHARGIMEQGVGYWSGTVEFERMSRGGFALPDPNEPGNGVKTGERLVQIAKFEAFLAAIAGGVETFKVPMPRQAIDVAPVSGPESDEFGLVASSLAIPPVAKIRTAAMDGAVRVHGFSAIKIRIRPGTRLTVNGQLFMAKFDAMRAVQNIVDAAPKTVPDWKVPNDTEVHIENPYCEGRAMPSASVSMMRRGSWAGPWTIAWEQA